LQSQITDVQAQAEANSVTGAVNTVNIASNTANFANYVPYTNATDNLTLGTNSISANNGNFSGTLSVLFGGIFRMHDDTLMYFGTDNDASMFWDTTKGFLSIRSENITANDDLFFTNFDTYDFDSNVVIDGNLELGSITNVEEEINKYTPTNGFTGTLNLTNATTLVATPTAGAHAATKAYVDAATNAVSTSSDDWSCLSLGLAMAAVGNVTHAWMGNYSGATYGVIGTSGANSNQTYNAVFHGVCPPDATATNLVTEVLWQSPDSIDGQVIYATIIDYDNVGGNDSFARSLSIASGLTSLTWTQSVNTVTTKLIQTTSGNVADTAANRVLVRVRTKWIE
jgi:hypothetical protein